MEENKPEFKDYGSNEDESIFDRSRYKNQEARERQFRILRVLFIVIATAILAFLVFRLTTFGTRALARFIGEIEQPTPTATLDLSSLIVQSPTPPPTATVLVGGSTYVSDVGEAVAGDGAIFFTPEPTATNTPTVTPLPTPVIGNFANSGDAPTLNSELRLKDPRCAPEETEVDYVYCMIRLAEEPIEP